MIRIGVVNIDVSHPKAFSAYMEKAQRARYVAIYNDGFRGDDEVEAFMKNVGLEKRCANVDELAEMVDIGFIQGCNWDKHLRYVEPFIQRGKPVFIDKPIVGNMHDIHKLEQYTKQGAVILGSSSVRYAYEIQEFLKIPVEERGEIVHIQGTNGVDEFNYGIHIVEAIGGLLGKGAIDCTFIARADVAGKACETFLATFENGITATYSLFQGTWQPFTLTILTTKSTYTLKIDTTKIYGALLDKIFDYMETGINTLADMDTLLDSVKIMLAGKISRENGGKTIRLDQIPADYAGYDGNTFETGYAAAAQKIYLQK